MKKTPREEAQPLPIATITTTRYSQRVNLLPRRPSRVLVYVLVLAAAASAIVAMIATHEASPLRPAWVLGSSTTHSYVATKSQWEIASNAQTVAWVTGALALALFLSALTTWAVAYGRTRTPHKPA
ncbi:hypothetical protein ABIC61_002558 [Curtobacterium sp. 1544]